VFTIIRRRLTFLVVTAAAVAGVLCCGCADNGMGGMLEEFYKANRPNPPDGGTVYTITFDANGGSVKPKSAVTDTNGKLTDLPTPAWSDHTFEGWYTLLSGGQEVTKNWGFSESITIYAHWTTYFTITFDANGGSVSPKTGVTAADSTLDTLPTPTCSGYNFNGWFTTATGDTAVTANYKFSDNTTIYARWSVVDYDDYSLSCGTRPCEKDSMPDGKVWMTENLNYKPSSGNSWCYGNDSSNCDTYGRLYDWATAMGVDTKYNSQQLGGVNVTRQGICPKDWHLPSRQEWAELAQAAGGTGLYGDGGMAGKNLKSKSGWNNNGTDDFEFSALPGGVRDYNGGAFRYAGSYGYWWTATEVSSGYAYYRYMYDGYDDVKEGNYHKSNGYSVRCLEDY